MHVNLKKLGANIKRFRAEAGVSQTDLGWMIGKPQQRVGEWENGIHAMSVEAFAMICEALQVNPNKLLEGVVDMRTIESILENAQRVSAHNKRILKKAIDKRALSINEGDFDLFEEWLDHGEVTNRKPSFFGGYTREQYLEWWKDEFSYLVEDGEELPDLDDDQWYHVSGNGIIEFSDKPNWLNV